MAWFEDVFLQSIFEKTGANNGKWLTVKQTSICCQYMQQESRTYESKYGERYKALMYTTVWNGREVWLYYSKLNGCGQMYFDYNDAEKAELQAREDEEKQQRTLAHIQRCYQKHPDKYAKKIVEIKEEIAYWEEDLKDCIANGEDTTETVRCLKESQSELKLWESVRDS
jgi:hypothetical protein